MRIRWLKTGLLAVMASLIFSSMTGSSAQAGTSDEKRLVFDAVEQFKATADYTCKLDKRVRKEGVLYEDLSISVKYKKPRHYYFRWEEGPAKGREVIFVGGKHDGRLVAHPGGKLRFLTLHLDPQGRLAMKANRHSLQNSGMEKIIDLIESNYRRAQEKAIQAIRYAREGDFYGRPVWIMEGIFPPNQDFYAHKVIICFDKTIRLPVKISIYDWSDKLVEEYAFRELNINVGLTEDDFDPHNPSYDYFMGKK